MPRLSINEVTTYRWTFEEDVLHYQRAGIEAIGVWRQKLSDFGEERGIELLEESGLKVSNLLWAGGFTGSDGHSYRESINDAVEAIRLAGELGSECLVLYSGSRNGHTLNHARRLFADALLELLPVAAEAGVTLAVEPMHQGCAGEWTYLTTLDESLALLDAVGSPRLKLVFDTYHLGREPKIVERIGRIVEHVGIVHLGDGRQTSESEQNRKRLGEGVLPLREIIAALLATGYDGYFDIELLGEDFEAGDYDELVAGSKRAYERLIAGETLLTTEARRHGEEGSR